MREVLVHEDGRIQHGGRSNIPQNFWADVSHDSEFLAKVEFTTLHALHSFSFLTSTVRGSGRRLGSCLVEIDPSTMCTLLLRCSSDCWLVGCSSKRKQIGQNFTSVREVVLSLPVRQSVWLSAGQVESRDRQGIRVLFLCSSEDNTWSVLEAHIPMELYTIYHNRISTRAPPDRLVRQRRSELLMAWSGLL